MSWGLKFLFSERHVLDEEDDDADDDDEDST